MVIVLVAAVLCSAGCAAEKEAGLVLHYSFDKGVDNTIQDQSGHGNDGTILGGTKWATGEFGSAIELNGADGYVDCGVKPSLDIGKAAGLRYVYVGNLPGSKAESTTCYNCGKLLIDRLGYTIRSNNIKTAACPTCNAQIAGVGLD